MKYNKHINKSEFSEEAMMTNENCPCKKKVASDMGNVTNAEHIMPSRNGQDM